MHLSAIPRRRPVPPFINHTPKAYEFHKAGKLHQSSAMFGPTGMVVPVMLPAPSAKPVKPDVPESERSSTGDSVSHASSQADAQSSGGTRPTSSEVDHNEEARSPFVDKMMTQTNLLVLPPSNPSYQMAYFLKTTGPVKEPPVRAPKSKRISSAMRIFKNSSRRPSESTTAAHMRFVKPEHIQILQILITRRLNHIISEEKDIPEFETQPADDASQTSKKPLLTSEQRLPDIVIPKVSKTGESGTDSIVTT